MMHSFLTYLRLIVYKLGISAFFKTPLRYLNDAEQISCIIYEKITSGKPCMIARFGSTELDITASYLGTHKYRHKYLRYILGETPNWWWDKNSVKMLKNNAGFINPCNENLTNFSKMMIEDMKLVDVLGSWRQEEQLFQKELSNAVKARLRFIEPFWGKQPWTRALKGKKVLVIHPFAETILKQYKKKELLFDKKETLPEFASLQVIKAVQSIGGESEFKDWFEALRSMETQMDALEYDICLIGCGAYGFPLAAHAKRTGHQAVHLGGALQLLFGIAGKRWFDPVNNPTYNDYKVFLNNYWVYPSESEKPKAANSVEGGCYW